MKKWQAHKTLLVVGEGYDEVAFLNHLKQFPGVCGKGVEITIKNARGKGAAGVIDCAIKLKANAAFDKVAVLLDTDTDWTPAVAKLAKRNSVQVLTSERHCLLRSISGSIDFRSLKITTWIKQLSHRRSALRMHRHD